MMEGRRGMQLDFHYYATYCAAIIAGYTHDESLDIAYSAQFVDECTRTLLGKLGGPLAAATTQMKSELMDAGIDPISLQDITRIWASFHFLPGDLYAKRDGCTKKYLHKYRLICNTNGELLKDTVELARGKSLQAAGIAMHVLADTWAHRYFAGTPSYAINNTNNYFFEIIPDGNGFTEREIRFNNNPASADDPDRGVYTASMRQVNENTIMNLGHGRAGHFPDYSYARYRYLPAWGQYAEVVKDNPSDYLHAFCQMIYALKSLRDENGSFETDRYEVNDILPYRYEIRDILVKRQTDACADWKALAERLSGHEVEDFSISKYQSGYRLADQERKDDTFLGRFFVAALAQKSMVTNRIYSSGNRLAGVSIDYDEKGFRGIRDFRLLLERRSEAEDE